MILIGIENCPTCKTVKAFIPDVEYIELKKEKGSSDQKIYEIKKVLGKLNSTLQFPVILNDDMTKIILTDEILNNLNKQKLEHILEN